MKIGILREEKIPIDRRVPLLPHHCVELQEQYGCSVVVQPSKVRAIQEAEYTAVGIQMQEDLSDCDVLLGVKEVPVDCLIPGKTYFFFSHTYKEQPYNAKLLRAIVDQGISLVDYELLEDASGHRVVAFGRYAGLVGAYNTLRGLGQDTGNWALKPAHECHDLKDMWSQLTVNWPSDLRIVLTGKGRVGNGAAETLRAAGIPEVSPTDFLANTTAGPVYTQIDSCSYYARKDGGSYNKAELYEDPTLYESVFMKFAKSATVFIAGHYYDQRAAFIYSKEMANHPDNTIRYVGDVSCDIDGPVCTTVRPSTIDQPFYHYDPSTGAEGAQGIGVMAVDNLPCELPRDASSSFGDDLMKHVLPNLFNGDPEGMLANATETNGDGLTEKFSYLEDYIKVNHG